MHALHVQLRFSFALKSHSAFCHGQEEGQVRSRSAVTMPMSHAPRIRLRPFKLSLEQRCFGSKFPATEKVATAPFCSFPRVAFPFVMTDPTVAVVLPRHGSTLIQPVRIRL